MCQTIGSRELPHGSSGQLQARAALDVSTCYQRSCCHAARSHLSSLGFSQGLLHQMWQQLDADGLLRGGPPSTLALGCNIHFRVDSPSLVYADCVSSAANMRKFCGLSWVPCFTSTPCFFALGGVTDLTQLRKTRFVMEIVLGSEPTDQAFRPVARLVAFH